MNVVLLKDTSFNHFDLRILHLNFHIHLFFIAKMQLFLAFQKKKKENEKILAVFNNATIIFIKHVTIDLFKNFNPENKDT